MTTIGLLLGKPPRPATVMAELVERLERLGARVLVHAGPQPPSWLPKADLVAVRGLSDETLGALVATEGAGVRYADPPSVVLAARDRAGLHARLRAAGIASPTHVPAADWEEVRRIVAARSTPSVVKHHSGEVGRGAHVHHVVGGEVVGELAPFAGPYLVEDAVVDVRAELKLYLVGDRLAAFHLGDRDVPRARGDNDAPRARGDNGADRPLDPDPTLATLADRVADAVGLRILGIDVLVGRDGPAVVDVNAFPSCQRLPDPAGVLARHLLDRAAAAAAACPPATATRTSP